MAQVIIFTNENGGVSVCVPTGELPIQDVLVKDCPLNAIIVDDSQLPVDKNFFDAWELINGVVTVNQVKKQAIIDAKQAVVDAKESANNKLKALGLTDEEIKALKGVA
jgi:hypothetical protein